LYRDFFGEYWCWVQKGKQYLKLVNLSSLTSYQDADMIKYDQISSQMKKALPMNPLQLFSKTLVSEFNIRFDNFVYKVS